MMIPAIDKQQMRLHFSEHAGEYDLYARIQKEVAGRLLDLPLDDAAPGPVLDVGTGTGDVARRLREREPERELVISDIAHEMTRTARHALPDSLAVDGDAQALPFRNGSFGLILCSSVLQWVEDLDAVFAECRRVLKPGGVLAFAMFCDGTLKELGDVFRRALAASGSDWPFHFQKFPRPDDIRSSLAMSGLLADHFHVAAEREYHASFRDLLVSLKRIGAQNVSRSRPSGLFPRRVMLEMKRLYLADYETGQGVPASYGIVYARARKQS